MTVAQLTQGILVGALIGSIGMVIYYSIQLAQDDTW